MNKDLTEQLSDILFKSGHFDTDVGDKIFDIFKQVKEENKKHVICTECGASDSCKTVDCDEYIRIKNKHEHETLQISTDIYEYKYMPIWRIKEVVVKLLKKN